MRPYHRYPPVVPRPLELAFGLVLLLGAAVVGYLIGAALVS